MKMFACVLAAAVCAAAIPAGARAEDGPTLADREAIEATLYRYSRGLDRGDAELYASAWAPDGVFAAGNMEAQGHDALKAMAQGVADRREQLAADGEPPRQLFHMDANSSVEFDGADHAYHHAYFLTLARSGEGAETDISVVQIGSTVDELRKIDGEWLIVKRTVSEAP